MIYPYARSLSVIARFYFGSCIDTSQSELFWARERVMPKCGLVSATLIERQAFGREVWELDMIRQPKYCTNTFVNLGQVSNGSGNRILVSSVFQSVR